MASIAYITDQNMISFHRLNGNTDINFWRPSANKKISDFKKGDILFFLAKGTEKGRKREKGIIGYGKLKQSKTLSLKGMWKHYKERNGYPTLALLTEAICKVSKDKQIPERLNCLELGDVVFFQEPVYLSEFHVTISNKIESFFYLDKDDSSITTKILQKADEFGVDMWAAMIQNEDQSDFRQDVVYSAVIGAYELGKDNYYSSYENKRNAKYASTVMKHYSQASFLPESKGDFIIQTENEIMLVIPVVVNSNTFKASIQYVIGHYQVYHTYLNKVLDNHEDVHIMLFFNQDIDSETTNILNLLKVNYQIMEK